MSKYFVIITPTVWYDVAETATVPDRVVINKSKRELYNKVHSKSIGIAWYS